jgi:transporter family-2 protein
VDDALALAFMAAGGVLAAFQAPLNGALSQFTGSLAAALVSFAVGALLLGLLVVVTGSAGGLAGVADVDVDDLLGGVVGATYVTAALIAVATIGAGALSAAVITGQLAAAVFVIDNLGILGLEAKPLSVERVAGVILLLAGTAAITRVRTTADRTPDGGQGALTRGTGRATAHARGNPAA